jgi:hypothetical protein
MKNLKTLCLLALFTFASCSDDDNTNTNPNQVLTDSWSLLQTTGTIAGITHDFTIGTIVWKFNPNNTVTVTNNTTDENLQSGFPSGTYQYTVNDNPLTASCQKNITINLEKFGCISINDNQMDINQNTADGINYHFEKVMPFTIE